MPERIAVGMVGCGFFAQNHLNSWRDLKAAGADLVAVCDVDVMKAKAAADKFGVAHWYTDAAAMFRERELGLVDIATRMETHPALVNLAIDRGIPTVVQKPFAPVLDECIAMTERAGRAGVFLAVHENFRFQKPIREAANVIRSGAIGTPSWARISFRTGYDIYAGQPYLLREQRFAVIDVGVHVLDVARVFLGEIEHVSAELQRRNPRVQAEDTATMLIRHRSGAVSVVEVTYESRRLPDAFPETVVELEGPDGGLALKPGAIMEVTAGGSMRASNVDAPVLPWAERPWHVVQESVYATCAHMLSAVRDGKPADTSAADNLKTFAAAEAAYASAVSGRAERPQA
jgi:predicted dehydrogenase